MDQFAVIDVLGCWSSGSLASAASMVKSAGVPLSTTIAPATDAADAAHVSYKAQRILRAFGNDGIRQIDRSSGVFSGSLYFALQAAR